jgi:hypothetical protein
MEMSSELKAIIDGLMHRIAELEAKQALLVA